MLTGELAGHHGGDLLLAHPRPLTRGPCRSGSTRSVVRRVAGRADDRHRNQYVAHSNNANIRIARSASSAHTGHVSEGPVVMVYSVGSTSRPITATGAGWLWIFDAAPTEGPQLLQVSASSGRGRERRGHAVDLPADHGGQRRRTLARSLDLGWRAGRAVRRCTRRARARGRGPGTGRRHGDEVGGDRASVGWLVGSGHDLWSGIGPSCDQQTIRRYNGTNPQPVFAVADRGYDPNSVVGDETHGLWTMQWVPPLGTAIPTAAPRPQVIVRIDPDTGAESVGGESAGDALPEVQLRVGRRTGRLPQRGSVSPRTAVRTGRLHRLHQPDPRRTADVAPDPRVIRLAAHRRCVVRTTDPRPGSCTSRRSTNTTFGSTNFVKGLGTLRRLPKLSTCVLDSRLATRSWCSCRIPSGRAKSVTSSAPAEWSGPRRRGWCDWATLRSSSSPTGESWTGSRSGGMPARVAGSSPILSVTDGPPGTYVICPVCRWEDDLLQSEAPGAHTGREPRQPAGGTRRLRAMAGCGDAEGRTTTTSAPEERP